jgi:hypothetical protein
MAFTTFIVQGTKGGEVIMKKGKLIFELHIFLICLILSVVITGIASTYQSTSAAPNGVALGVTKVETNPISSSISSSDAQSDLRDNENLEFVFGYFTKKGLSLAAASGITANLKAESGLNPARVQDRTDAAGDYAPEPGVGFGIAQWTVEDRQNSLVAFASDQGKSITDLELQLDFLWQEMESNFPEMLERLRSIDGNTDSHISDPIEAAIVFHGNTDKIENDPIISAVNPGRGFEASNDSAHRVIENRCKVAENIYAYKIAQS